MVPLSVRSWVCSLSLFTTPRLTRLVSPHQTGSVVRLCMGMEPCFHVDCERPTHAFNPCGHMASEATVRYWSAVMIPHGTNGFHSMCPFCATPLSAPTPHVRLIFQDNLD